MTDAKMKPHNFKSIISSSIGNVLEWYEYTLYAYFAKVISTLFFPTADDFVAMLMTFATFAVGLAARPVGGIIFGHIGDKYSRKKMLTLTMFLMSIPTMLIGMLPTYDQIGIFAPIFLIMLRIIQGVALGGEFGASCVYLFESVPENKRGFFGTLALTGVGTGLVLSSLTIVVVEALATEQQIYYFAWRIPFFISVIGSFVAYYMRMNLLESDDFIIAQKEKKLTNNPFLTMLKTQKTTLIPLFGIFLTTQVSFFVVFIFGKTMMIDFLHFSPDVAGKYNLYTVISYTISTVIFGYLSDKIEKRYIILAGIVSMFFASYPFVFSLESGSNLAILLMSILFGALIGMTEGTLNPLVASSFPTHIRATSVAFCWNFTSVAFGGSAPMFVLWLNNKFHDMKVVAYFLMTVTMISTFSVIYTIYTFKKNRGKAEEGYLAGNSFSS